MLGRIRTRWDGIRLAQIKPLAIQEWLKTLTAAPKTKGHIKALLHRLYEKAMLWEMVELQRNPMQLVEIKGISKRQKKPLVLTVEQYDRIVDFLVEPYRTMVIVAQCLGLRAEEVLALHWSDIDFEHLTIRVSRAVVHGRIKSVKTEYSEDELPLDPEFAVILLEWKRRASSSELVFPSHITGRNFHASPIQQDYIRPAGEKLGLKGLGWHTFRHTYRSWLDASGAPLGVQQKLMRHAQISTTMNIYGNALMDSKREAVSKVAKLALRSA